MPRPRLAAARQRDWQRVWQQAWQQAWRLAWCLLGAGAALGLALALTWQHSSPAAAPLLLASLGGTTVFLFGLTRAPAAQPRALWGGHLGGAVIGIACYQAFGEALWVYLLALMLTLGWMLLTRSVHPPAGANPLIMVHGHAGWSALWSPLALGLLALVGVAWVWSRSHPGITRYPQRWWEPSPPSPLWGAWQDEGRPTAVDRPSMPGTSTTPTATTPPGSPHVQ